MFIKQISVFLENRKGRLAKATQILGENNINISALCVADTADYGVLRLIVNKPEEAKSALKNSEFTVIETDVIALFIDDNPGGLSRVLRVLDEANVSVEYIYAFAVKHNSRNQALAAFKVEDNLKALSALHAANIETVEPSDIYKL